MGIKNMFSGFGSQSHHYLPVFIQQTAYVRHAAEALYMMTDTMEPAQWRKYEKEIKACEIQGDAILAELHEYLYGAIIRRIRRSDVQTIAMNIDEFLDAINDAAKSIPQYSPKRIDTHIADLAQYIMAEADSLVRMMPYLGEMKKNYSQISVQCERITELEHAADDTYSEYISYIFEKESDPIELMKYKNIAEILEAATDAAKRVSYSIRKIIVRYSE